MGVVLVAVYRTLEQWESSNQWTNHYRPANKQIIKTSTTLLHLFGILVAGLKHVKDGKSAENVALSVKRCLRITLVCQLLLFIQLQQKSTPTHSTICHIQPSSWAEYKEGYVIYLVDMMHDM